MQILQNVNIIGGHFLKGPPPPCTPITHRRHLLDTSGSNSLDEERCLMAPLAQDETQLLPGSPMGYMSPSVSCYTFLFITI